MPRPQRCRRICSEPMYKEFSPADKAQHKAVVLTLDEFEVIRLVDLESHTHEQCAKMMDISRSTVTEIYESARKKLAECLVNGCQLVIKGGNYRFCDGSAKNYCGKRCDRKQGCRHRDECGK